MVLGALDPLGIFVGLYAVAVGVLGVARPQTMFKMRHWLSVTSDSELSELGVLWYRVSGALATVLGLWLLYDWGNVGLVVAHWLGSSAVP
ncbi:hypothetical protein [Haloprofundus sp. MHR1]|uniref:hypothetical protein n=1 Tax=Haloprofundus sp. MHR1 TaxID=2572921 RepID=UPI0010BEE5A9|nr:hypothetical protein [Haloprofundus sp. MHR1]QCJ47901.1 hypothetical protein FCF25_12585 [Haloprofundus sp. MHR1]